MAPKKRKVVSVKKVVREIETVQVSLLETDGTQTQPDLVNELTAARTRREEDRVVKKTVPVEEPAKGGKSKPKGAGAVTVKPPRKKAGKRRRMVDQVQGGTGKEEYRRYLLRVLKEVHPGMAISSRAMTILNSMMNDMFERLAGEAARLSDYTKRATLSAREIQGAVRLVLPGDLGRHALAEGAKAVSNYAAKTKPKA